MFVNSVKECILALNIEDKVIDNNWNTLISMCSLDKRKRMERYKLYIDKKRLICGELLIQYYLKKFLGLNIDLQYQYNSYGKPYLEGIDINFNISHSGEWVICGFSTKDIGIDIEKIQSVSNQLLDKCFSEKEISYILDDNGNVDAERFTEMWTKKESYVKYLGIGLGYGLKSFSVDIFNGSSIDKVQKVYLHSTRFKEDYYISKCCEDDLELGIIVIKASDILEELVY